MTALLIYALLTSSAFYLGSRAVITRPLWSRYPRSLAIFMDCAACSGFWYGCAAGALLHDVNPILPSAPSILSAAIIGLCSVVWTPIVAGLMQAGFERLGSAIEEDSDG